MIAYALILALMLGTLLVAAGQSEMAKLAAVATLAACLALSLSHRLRPADRWILVGYLAAAVLACACALEPLSSVIGSLQRAQGGLAALAMVVLAASGSTLGAPARLRVYSAIALLGALMGAYALLQRFGLDPWRWSDGVPGRPAVTLSNAVVLGGYLALCLPVTAYLTQVIAVRPARLGQLGMLLVALILQLGGLLASGTRSAMLALAMAGAFLGLLSVQRARRWLLPAVLLIAALVCSLAALRPDSLSDRTQLWTMAWRALQSEQPLRDLAGGSDAMHNWRPVVGVGLDLQQVALRAARPASAQLRPEAADLQADRAHQWLLDRLLESGWLGVIASLALAMCVAWRLRQSIGSADPHLRREACALAVALGAWVIHLQMNFALTGDRTLAWILIGCVFALSQRPLWPTLSRENGPWTWVFRFSLAAALLLGAMAASGIVRGLNPTLASERDFRAGQQHYMAALANPSGQGAIQFASAAQYFEAAAKQARYDTDAALAAASAWVEAAQSARDPRNLAAAQHWLDAVAAMDPKEPRLERIQQRVDIVRQSLSQSPRANP